MTQGMTRRQALSRGLAGLTVVAAGGAVWRAWDNGVFSAGDGPAYEPWHTWRKDKLDGPLALVQAGILASNAHNTQPWRFHVSADRIAIHADHDRHLGAFDPFRREMTLSLGCALENIVLAARAGGYAPTVETVPGRLPLGTPVRTDEPVAFVHLEKSRQVASELFHAIARRHTHRGAYDMERPVSKALRDEMRTLSDGSTAIRLFVFPAGPEKTRLGEVIVSATEEIVADDAMAEDSARWFRFDRRAVDRHRDGVTMDGFGLPPLVNAAIKIIPAPSPEEADRQWLDATRTVHVATAGLLGLIAVDDLYDRPTAVEAGRLWQRLHLWATARGLAAQPLNQAPERVDREAELGLAPHMATALSGITGDPAWRPTFAFRMGYAARAARLSPRRSLDAVVV